MNRLNPPDFADDNEALDALSTNTRLKSYPELQPHVGEIKTAYQQYTCVQGDAVSINNVVLPIRVQEHLKKLYASPPNTISFINDIRAESDADCCPMCGSFHSGTLDHVLPKANYPVFAIFSRNLVPACKCNSKRSDLTIGDNPGERILHPYFDDILGQRLVKAQFNDLGEVPSISLELLIGLAIPEQAAVRFHVENVLMRTSILRYLGKSWANLLRRPKLIASDLRRNPTSRERLREILIEELDRQDDTHGSMNNWMSVFIAGLLDDHVLDWMFAAFQRPGRRADDPLITGIT